MVCPPKLKPLISDDEIGVSQKYEDHRTRENVTNYLMFTNYSDALAVSDEGRRYFVVASPLQRSEDIRALAVAEGMVGLREDGLRKAVEGITSLAEIARVVK